MLFQCYQTNFEDVFTGISFAQVDPQDGQVLYPQGAYPDAPPAAKEGHVAVRVGDCWVIVEDPRGKLYIQDGVEKRVDVVKFVLPEGAQWKSDYLKSLSVRELYSVDVQIRLNSFAATRNYDSITTAVTYETSSVQKYQYEGRRARELRDSTWVAFDEYANKVEDGELAKPSVFSQIEPYLPNLSW